MKYTLGWLASIRKRLEAVEKDFMEDYSIEVAGEFNSVPLLEQVRFITEMGNGNESPELKERIAKLSVLGKPVTVYFRGKQIGVVTINDMANRFDDQDVLRNNPPAYSLLLEVCSRKVVEKYLPPREESGPPAAAGKTTPGSPPPSAAR